jgi:alanine racemase
VNNPVHTPSPEEFTSPRLELSLDNLEDNLLHLQSRGKGQLGTIAVVKDNAYGCGSAPIARFLQQRAVTLFAVASAAEARHLRRESIQLPILVLGEATLEDLRWGHENGIDFALNSIATLRLWRSNQLQVRFHCNIDTGMSRLGIVPQLIDELLQELKDAPGLVPTGLFTHFACADEMQSDSVAIQSQRFRAVITRLQDYGLHFKYIHCSNTAATLRHIDTIPFTHIRPGIGLYGCQPDPQQHFAPLKQIATFIGRVVMVKHIAAGTAVSYGWHYVANQPTWIATVHCGYAHGVPRFLSNRGTMLIGEKPYPIAGNVTMDYCMVDIGPQPVVTIGDEAVLFGQQQRAQISLDSIASQGGTISYEILCHLSAHIQRVYRYQGAVVEVVAPHFF